MLSILTRSKPAKPSRETARPEPIEKQARSVRLPFLSRSQPAFPTPERVMAYRKKCIAVGAPVPLDVARLVERGIIDKIAPIYDTSSVYRYMDALIQKEREAQPDLDWYWSPYIGSCEVIRNPRDQDGKTINWHKTVPVRATYTKLVPEYIIDRCKRIKNAFPREFDERSMGLFITDYGVVHPDPFLALHSRQSNALYVIGVWDEPGF